MYNKKINSIWIAGLIFSFILGPIKKKGPDPLFKDMLRLVFVDV